MSQAESFKAKRAAAGIAGNILCKKLGIARSRLSDIERGYVVASPAELARMENALDELIRTKSVIDQVATSLGWPTGVRHD
jgi:transcriptional regulator with XRE-family HTH domain